MNKIFCRVSECVVITFWVPWSSVAAMAKVSTVPVAKFHFVTRTLATVAVYRISEPTLLSCVIPFSTHLAIVPTWVISIVMIVSFIVDLWSMPWALLALIVAGRCRRVFIVAAAVPVALRLRHPDRLTLVVTWHALLAWCSAGGPPVGWLVGQVAAVEFLAALVVTLSAPCGTSGLWHIQTPWSQIWDAKIVHQLSGSRGRQVQTIDWQEVINHFAIATDKVSMWSMKVQPLSEASEAIVAFIFFPLSAAESLSLRGHIPLRVTLPVNDLSFATSRMLETFSTIFGLRVFRGSIICPDMYRYVSVCIWFYFFKHR